MAGWSFAILIAVGLIACTRPKESAFYRSFSLQKLVAETGSQFGLDCGTGGGGGGGSHFGIWSAGPIANRFQSQKGETCVCNLQKNGTEDFDEIGLMMGVAKSVEREITNSGARIVEQGSHDPTSFYFEYALDNVKGRVEIACKLLPTHQYNFDSSVQESGRRVRHARWEELISSNS